MTMIGPCCQPVLLMNEVTEVMVDWRLGQYVGIHPTFSDVWKTQRVSVGHEARSTGSPCPEAHTPPQLRVCGDNVVSGGVKRVEWLGQ